RRCGRRARAGHLPVVAWQRIGAPDERACEGRPMNDGPPHTVDAETLREVYADPQAVAARIRLAHVHQWRGEFAESNLPDGQRESSRLALAAARRHMEES